MIELTTSPTVRAAFFFSEFCLFLMSHQSNRKMITERILMKQQTPTYLHGKGGVRAHILYQLYIEFFHALSILVSEKLDVV